MLGAGSAFTARLAKDIMLIPGLEGGEFAVVDIDAGRLDLAGRLIRRMIELTGKPWTVRASTDRTEVMAGSDFLINTIEVSGVATVGLDYEIPRKYGVDQCIGDTIGPGGLFKLFRTAPAWVEILRDAERLCPRCLVLNYTNPMSMMTLLACRSTSLPVVGLCHSVQGTSRKLARYLDVPYGELEWECAGINHMAWFTRLEREGQDQYPRLLSRLEEEVAFAEGAAPKPLYEYDPVRFDVLKHFGAFVTESSGHFSEYVPYYRKRGELIDEYCREEYLGGRGFYSREWPTWRREKDEKIRRQLAGQEEISLERSVEYASEIIGAVCLDRPAVIHGSVLNAGLIDNLPADGVVEVACLADRRGVQPTRFGRLPDQLAALCRSNTSCFELGVQAAAERSREKARYAVMLDPLTAAVCSPGEIARMTDELFAAEKDYLPGWQ
jgi:alpha-galactosidase